MKEPMGIPKEQLLSCLQDQYNFNLATLEFLPLGLDFNAAVYRAVNEQTVHLIKVTSRPLYEPQFLVPRYLSDQGIAGVVVPIPAKSGALWTQLESWTVMVYP